MYKFAITLITILIITFMSTPVFAESNQKELSDQKIFTSVINLIDTKILDENLSDNLKKVFIQKFNHSSIVKNPSTASLLQRTILDAFNTDLGKILKSDLVINKIKTTYSPSAKINSSSHVKVDYYGFLPDGSSFDNSYERQYSFDFQNGSGTVIPGFEQGVIGSSKGDIIQINIGSDLAYGQSGIEGLIPKNSNISFIIEILDVQDIYDNDYEDKVIDNIPKDLVESGIRWPYYEDIALNNADLQTSNPILITFTDFRCPFCAEYHKVLTKLASERPDTAIFYRNFPLTALHPEAYEIAVGAQCVKSQVGAAGALKFIDYAFKNQAKDLKLNDVLKNTNFNNTTIRECVEDNSAVIEKIEADTQEAYMLEFHGTPTTFIITPTNKVVTLHGAYSYQNLIKALDSAEVGS